MNNELDKFLDSSVDAACTMDFRTFGETVVWFSYDPLIAKNWTQRILKMIDDSKKSRLTPKAIATLLPSMSQLRNMMIYDLWMSKYTNISRQNRLKIFNFYNILLKSRSLEDPYAISKNIIHTKEEITNFLSKIKSATPVIAKKLGRLVNACYHLSQAMYSDMNPSIVYDNYGPYKAGKKYESNYIVVIKEFDNLRAPELWPESNILPCNFIQIIYLYKNIKMTVDAFSHTIYKGDLIKGLEYFDIKVDSKNYPINKLDGISESIEKVAIQIFKKFQNLNFEKRKEKYYFTKAYFYKKLYEKLGQDWKPAKEILAEAHNKKLHYINWPGNKKKQKKIVRKTLDPRTDFFC